MKNGGGVQIRETPADAGRTGRDAPLAGPGEVRPESGAPHDAPGGAVDGAGVSSSAQEGMTPLSVGMAEADDWLQAAAAPMEVPDSFSAGSVPDGGPVPGGERDGNGFLVYDENDLFLSGGDGIDFLLAADSGLHLDDLIESGRVGNVEVLLLGNSDVVNSLAGLSELRELYGVTVDADEEGNARMTLDKACWNKTEDGVYQHHRGDAGMDSVDLTMDLASAMRTISEDDEAVIQFAISHAGS